MSGLRPWPRFVLALPLIVVLVLAPGQALAQDDALASADVTEMADMLDRIVTGSGDYAEAEQLALQLEAVVNASFGPESREALDWRTFQAGGPEVEAAVARLRAGIDLRLGLRRARARTGSRWYPRLRNWR